MTTSGPLKEATRLLRDAIEDPGDVCGMPAGRDAAVARIAEALRARGQANRRRHAFRTPLLAAAVILLASGAAFAVHRSHRDATSGASADATGARNLGRLVEPTGSVTALRDGHTESVGQGARLAEGTELRTSGSAEASLDFDSGTHVTLGGSSRVRLVEQSSRKRFALEAGSFSAKVAKLTADERFVVVTPDAEVEVRGTAFRVTIVPGDPACEGGTPTLLEVSEGVVVVTPHGGAQVRVGAGEHWPSCAVTTAAAARSPDERAAPSAPSVSVAKPSAAMAAPGAPESPRTPMPEASSRLADQNDLFDDAMRRKRAGDPSGAVAKLDRLLTDYPSGPLSESASAERMRLLATSDPRRAPAAARDYLRHHPRGFARAEAEAIVAGSR